VKRFLSILLITVILSNGLGFYLFYALKLQQIRREMREALKLLPEHELDVLKLTRQEFIAALVEDHEVKVNGRMYDIARIAEQDEHIIIYCKHDEKEDNLLALLDHVLTAPIKAKAIPIVGVAFVVFPYVNPHGVSLPVPVEILVNTFTSYQFSSVTFKVLPATPPPLFT